MHWGVGDRERVFDVRLAPLERGGDLLGASVVYEDVTGVTALQAAVSDSRRELEEAYEELQATVEELETTNEELQSANEELETMNDELRHRTLKLNETNAFLRAILTTMGVAVAVLDRREHVQVWNGQAQELWGVSTDEAAGRRFLTLELGLPLHQLKSPLRAILAGSSSRQELVLDAVSREGKPFQCRVSCTGLTDGSEGEISGVVMLMEPVAPGAAP